MAPQPVPPHLIKPLSTDIGIEEFRGASVREESRRREVARRARAQSPSRVQRILGRLTLSRHGS
jgi:hypothetical protein